jgi:hypothetical protein
MTPGYQWEFLLGTISMTVRLVSLTHCRSFTLTELSALVSDELCGSFAVWLATKEAGFLHGRFVWSLWDIDELSTGEIRKRIEEDPYFLRISVAGLNGGNLSS